MAKHPPQFLAPQDENDLKMKTFNFVLFYILSVLVGMFQIPWNMRSLKKNGPSLTASLVLLFGITFSAIFDYLLFEGEHRGLKGLFGGLLFSIGVYFIAYEKHLYEQAKKGHVTLKKKTYNKLDEAQTKKIEQLSTQPSDTTSRDQSVVESEPDSHSSVSVNVTSEIDGSTIQ